MYSSLKLFAVSVLIVPSIAGQNVYLAGDSTMAKGGGGAGTDGAVVNAFSEILLRCRSRMGAIPWAILDYSGYQSRYCRSQREKLF